MLNLGFAGSASGAQASSERAQQPAGRPRRKRRYIVEIDGQEFEAESPAHAQAILERARELADKAAQSQADAVVARVTRKVRSLGKVRPVALKAPEIRTDAPIDLEPILADLRAIYAQAAREAEIRLMMERQAAMDDEEDAITLLL